MKIFCVGRNYVDHAKELNNPIPDAPVIFMKPTTAILKGKDFYLPDFSKDMHYECELVYRICKNGKYIDEQFASKYVDAVTVGIDFTARDVQQNQKTKGLPWEIAKAFDNSAVLGKWVDISNVSHKSSIKFMMQKNGETVQQGDSSLMIYSIKKIINYLSQFFTLQQGDLIYTGTPAGVSAVKIGDKLEGYLESEKMFEVEVK
ncbi:MAG: fumarylacetoacetate hydrolase family protein [Fimbriimonadaceae bacterium]|nr:fumarylacetoacetate hydrolase family protein [Chitinophagales bacterium]